MQNEVNDGGFRVYTVEELRAMPVGTKFDHVVLGECEIVPAPNSDAGKAMVFKGRSSPSHFVHDGWPFDQTMRLKPDAS